MARSLLDKRLGVAEKKTKAVTRRRDEAEARAVTPARFEEIMQGLDASYRDGEAANVAYIKTLSNGELLRMHCDRDKWVYEMAKQITEDHMAKLEADGIGIENMTEAEMLFILNRSKVEDGIDWDAIPLKELERIRRGEISGDDLRRRYPSRNKK